MTTQLAPKTTAPSGPPDGLERCTAIKRNGSDCTAQAIQGGKCIGHLPTANQARRKGGQNSARAVRAEKRLPGPLRVVGQILREALQDVRDGQLTAGQGSAMASIATALIRVHQADSLEERLQTLEERAEGGSL